MSPTRDSPANVLWDFAVRVRDAARKIGFGGGLERFLWRVALKVMPPPSGETQVALPTGAILTIPARTRSARTFASGRYEMATTRWLREHLGDGQTFVDVGANIGYYTLLASGLVGPAGAVCSFEPLPRNFEALSKNLDRNSCDNVVAVSLAVGSSPSEMFLIDDGESSHLREEGETGGVRVEVTSLDHYFGERAWPPVDLIKLDIEGGEMSALQGMDELSSRNPDLRLIMEYSPEAMGRESVSWSAFVARFRSLGFERCEILDQGLEAVPLEGTFASSSLHNLLLSKSG